MSSLISVRNAVGGKRPRTYEGESVDETPPAQSKRQKHDDEDGGASENLKCFYLFDEKLLAFISTFA